MKYFIMSAAVLQGVLQKNLERNMIMYTMLMNLFTGNLNLADQQPSDFPLRRYHSKEFDKLKKHLDNLLNEEGKELLDELLETNVSKNWYDDVDAFVSGFRLASLLMVEVFYDKEGLLENREQYLRHLIHRPYKGTPSAMDDFSEAE